MLFKSVYRSYTPTCYYVFFWVFLHHNVYANIWFFYGPIVPEIESILFYSMPYKKHTLTVRGVDSFPCACHRPWQGPAGDHSARWQGSRHRSALHRSVSIVFTTSQCHAIDLCHWTTRLLTVYLFHSPIDPQIWIQLLPDFVSISQPILNVTFNSVTYLICNVFCTVFF